MQHRIAISLSFLLALALGSVAAQQQDEGRPGGKQQDKKHVKATLTEPATPAPAPDAATEAEEAAPAGDAAADPAEAIDPAEAEAATDQATATSTDKPAGTGEAAAADPFQERIEVIEVLLDTIVKKNGKPVTGLGPDDFIVEEEGKPVAVTSARFYGTPDQLQATGEGDVERADRYFILFFHDRARDASFIRPLLLEAGQQARKWVEEQRLPNDQVAVVMWDVRLKVYTDFTRDPEQIVEAISRAVSAKKEPDRQAGRSREPLRPNADSPSLLLNLPAGRDLARESRVFEKSLALLGRAAEGIVGRKNLMLFSIGFGEVDSSGFWSPDVRYYPALEQNLNDGNVAVYSIHLLGPRGVSPSGGISSSLSSIASDTEGLYYDAFTSFMTPMKEVAQDTSGYYVLSYRSQYERGTSGYREVEVKTREKGYDVRARKGYMFGDENKPVSMPDAPAEDDEPPPRKPSTG